MSRRNGSEDGAAPILARRLRKGAGRLVVVLAVIVIVALSSAAVSRAGEPDCRPPLVDRQRFGYTAHAYRWHESFDIGQLRAGWYVDHSYTTNRPGGMDRTVLIKVRDPMTGKLVDPSQLGPVVDRNPGATWLVGNEPDCIWQDDVMPEDYARLYRGFYTLIKSRDQMARVAAGGIVQPTPLRLEYLNRVLAAYRARYGQDMPVDLWAIHNMVLSEEQGTGAEIPPGIEADVGVVRTPQDNDNLTMFTEQIWAFRQWMANHGYGGYPLIVTEFGILMPEKEHEFSPERVNAFMSATFDFFRHTKDSALGDPLDGGRLVQRWAWFSLDVHPYDAWGEGFNGNLFDPETAAITEAGQNFATHTEANEPLKYIDLGPAAFKILPAEQANPPEDVSRDVQVRIVNLGTVDAGSFEVELAYRGPTTGALNKHVSRLDASSSRWVSFRLANLAPGAYTVSIEIDPANEVDENAECNNADEMMLVVPTDNLYLPVTTMRGGRAITAPSVRNAGPAQAPKASPRAEEPGFQEFQMPAGNSYPAQIALDLANQVAWISERDGNKIAQFDLQTQTWGQEYKIPTAGSQPWGLVVDAQGNVWFAETAGNKIGKLDPATGKITEYDIPTPDSQPWAVAIGDDGSVWFTERSGNKIGRLAPDTGQFSEHDLLTLGAQPVGIATQGIYVWFTMTAVNKLGRLRTSDGRIIEFTSPTPDSAPQDVALNPRGKPWFTLRQGNKLLFIDIETHGLYTEFPVPTVNSEPVGLAIDGDVAIWFTEQAGNKLGRFPNNAPMRDYSLPTANSTPTDVAVDSAGCAWYTAPGANRIGRFCAPPVQPLYLPLVHR